MSNIITEIAKKNGRTYITPEDVSDAMNTVGRNDPHQIRIDVLEVLGSQTDFGAEDWTLCAFVAFRGPEEKSGNSKPV